MKTAPAVLFVVSALAGPASAEPVTQTYPASIDRVWSAAKAMP